MVTLYSQPYSCCRCCYSTFLNLKTIILLSNIKCYSPTLILILLIKFFNINTTNINVVNIHSNNNIIIVNIINNIFDYIIIIWSTSILLLLLLWLIKKIKRWLWPIKVDLRWLWSTMVGYNWIWLSYIDKEWLWMNKVDYCKHRLENVRSWLTICRDIL